MDFEVKHLKEAFGVEIEKPSIHKMLIESLWSAGQFLKS